MFGVFILVTKTEHWYLRLSRFNYCCPAWCYAFRCEISKVGWSDPPKGGATHRGATSCSSAKTLVVTLYWIFRSIIWFCNSADKFLMAHTYCTGPGSRPGMMGFYITICTIHTTQGQGTIVFYCAHPSSSPCSRPSPVQCACYVGCKWPSSFASSSYQTRP